MRDLGDSIMTLSICALFGQNPTEIVDADRMREQECDRIHAMVLELEKTGAEAEELISGYRVFPAKPGQLHGADIETYNDHRMAMCFSCVRIESSGHSD